MGCEQAGAKHLSLVYKKDRKDCSGMLALGLPGEVGQGQGKEEGKGREGLERGGEKRRDGVEGGRREGSVSGWGGPGECQSRRTPVEGRISEISEPRRMRFHWSVGCGMSFVRMT